MDFCPIMPPRVGLGMNNFSKDKVPNFAAPASLQKSGFHDSSKKKAAHQFTSSRVKKNLETVKWDRC